MKIEGEDGVAGVVEGIEEGAGGELLLSLLLLGLLIGGVDQPAGVHELVPPVGTLDPVAPGGSIHARVGSNNGRCIS